MKYEKKVSKINANHKIRNVNYRKYTKTYEFVRVFFIITACTAGVHEVKFATEHLVA